jgi:hypothetical protein
MDVLFACPKTSSVRSLESPYEDLESRNKYNTMQFGIIKLDWVIRNLDLVFLFSGYSLSHFVYAAQGSGTCTVWGARRITLA